MNNDLPNVKSAPAALTPELVGQLVHNSLQQRELLDAIIEAVAPMLPEPTKLSWIERRFEVFQAAERYLKARGILVSVVDRDAWVRTYRVTGYRSPVYLEQVVALAQYLGFEVPGE